MNRLNLEQVKAFLQVVRLGGVRKAAAALNLSQPAASARIRNLEQSLGKSLFDRSATGLSLTRDGELFLRYAEQFEHLAGLVEKNVIAPAGIEGYLRIGASETITQCWLPDFVSRLHHGYPNLQVEINVDISVNLRDGLVAREIDLAFLLGPVSEFSVDNIALPGFELAWYVAAGTPPPGQGPASYLSMPIITYARHTRPFRELKAMLVDRIGPGLSLFPSSSLSACFRLVEAGLGVAALPIAMGQPFVERGSIVEFDPGWRPEPLKFTASYIGEPRSQIVETAARLAAEVAQEYVGINNLDH